MIESVLMNVDKTSPPVPSKRKGIVDSDVKLFNFMLESSSED